MECRVYSFFSLPHEGMNICWAYVTKSLKFFFYVISHIPQMYLIASFLLISEVTATYCHCPLTLTRDKP